MAASYNNSKRFNSQRNSQNSFKRGSDHLKNHSSTYTQTEGFTYSQNQNGREDDEDYRRMQNQVDLEYEMEQSREPLKRHSENYQVYPESKNIYYSSVQQKISNLDLDYRSEDGQCDLLQTSPRENNADVPFYQQVDKLSNLNF